MTQGLVCKELKDINSKKTQLWATVAICSLFVGVGIPVWWKTTEVYRAELPYDAVSSLAKEKNVHFKAFIQLVNAVPDFQISLFASNLELELISKQVTSSVNLAYDVQVIDESNLDVLKRPVQTNTVKIVFELKDTKEFELLITKSRVIFCYLAKTKFRSESTLKSMQNILSQLIKDVIINEKRLNEVVLTSYGKTMPPSHDNFLRKAVKTNPKFELLFSLLCPEPEKVLADWNINDAVESLLTPMLRKLKPVFDFHVGSQVLYYTKISYNPTPLKENNTISLYYVTSDQLSHVINPIEAKLGSQLSSDPTLNFAVYITEKHQTPLYIKTEKNSYSKSNSFLVPRWGSMMFYNIENAKDFQGTLHHVVDVKFVIRSFLEHFRTLVGIPIFNDYFKHEQIHFEFPAFHGLTDWELDALMRLRAMENSASSIHSLESLSNLLTKVRNIVINDQIANEVYTAVDAITNAKSAAQNGNLSEFLRQSKQAFGASETAFFDPTLLELLYFPEDQKFAIYIPLFLPISLPLVLSILKWIKHYKQQSKAKTD